MSQLLLSTSLPLNCLHLQYKRRRKCLYPTNTLKQENGLKKLAAKLPQTFRNPHMFPASFPAQYENVKGELECYQNHHLPLRDIGKEEILTQYGHAWVTDYAALACTSMKPKQNPWSQNRRFLMLLNKYLFICSRVFNFPPIWLLDQVQTEASKLAITSYI